MNRFVRNVEKIPVANPTAPAQPEERLMLAVLEDAIITFQAGLHSENPQRRRRFCEVEQWVRERDLESPFSFESICSALQLDPDYIRDGLRRLRRNSRTRSLPRLRIRREPPRLLHEQPSYETVGGRSERASTR